jgi:hypothetical protein
MDENENEHERKHEKKWGEQSPENIKEILNVVSSEVPALVKNLLGSVFSEEAGRSMGKAAAAYYKEMKDGGLPEQVAVKLTEDYMRTFGKGDDIGKQAERKIHQRMEEESENKEEEEG